MARGQTGKRDWTLMWREQRRTLPRGQNRHSRQGPTLNEPAAQAAG